jgi:outer membrane protein OmpA-like peptidoglycan-associated protein
MNYRSLLCKTALSSAFLLALSAGANAQVTLNPTEDNYISAKHADQHAKWKKGEEQFPGRPRDMWQIGLGGGSFLVSGDVKSQFGWGTSLHARKSLGYVSSLRMEYMFGQASGLNYKASPALALPQGEPFTSNYSDSVGFYANYKIPQHHAISVQAVFNLNNIKFHKKQNKWAVNFIVGAGANLYRTAINALDDNGNKYDFSTVGFDNNGDPLDITSLQGRREVRNNLKGVLDDSYETNAPQNRNNVFAFGKDKPMVLNPFINTGFSLEYMITPRLSLSFEHQVYFTADDYMDGKYRNEAGTRTSGLDLPQYTSVRLGFHIGKKEKHVQPLWFVNPLLSPMGDIADLKKKLDDEWFKDKDKDGVPNKIDEEPETPEGAPVDTKGKSLDSDRDGVIDLDDKEPHSPPGFKVDKDGIADIPKPLTQKDVQVLKNPDGTEKLVIGKETFNPKQAEPSTAGISDWFLPMIHFDQDKFTLRPEAYAQLQHIANVMNAYPKIKVVVHGHTDVYNGEAYNDMLSYNRAMTAVDYLSSQYGISKDRFIVQYNGERKNLISSALTDTDHLQNRRVEFTVAKENDKSMDRPKDDGGANRQWKY